MNEVDSWNDVDVMAKVGSAIADLVVSVSSNLPPCTTSG